MSAVLEMMGSKEPFVKLSKVNKTFGFTVALRNINLTIDKGEIIGLIGNNGAGKSTLLRLIILLEKASRGKITVNGKVVI